ncbi:hypothetical protein B0A78_02745 [Flavobacterium columnare NBRC 100251 = ATCC 23463]|uniref:Uncharacterized protein n=1 Tax=Flavobacterium columnare TaxID=996 RepID=A0AAI8CHZ0_9FLAO|nr:hypothetical protein [Flavobacterium columnare]AMO20229.1 hypothetical protein UN65_07650 [Flavobacterium columnare]ANO49453.1 hypothetical protein Pf1_01208 [Flavobacterium columnare]APT22585.1 hypothetical protein BU993_08085 [Flavobacterium columnare]AUX18183.1 hypothetical protein AQ623_07800 [Flavobacterium columnare]MEB3801118.1 hypothetical protein [Flavobacterium columnare]
MKSLSEILQTVQTYHELGETIAAAEYVIKTFDIIHPNFGGFELREKAAPKFILMTTEGEFGKPQKIRIPENTFEFEFKLMLNLITHEMIHVGQKAPHNLVWDKNEREWQAYYEMIFHKTYPQIPSPANNQQLFFANKAIEYYNRMEKEGSLQKKYAAQKKEIENFIASLPQ